jgi:cyclase
VIRPRLIPVLLLNEDGVLVKTVKFGSPRYIGDPINAIRIFNDKGVDELFVLDIAAARWRIRPRFELIRDMASEAFMPVGYGGGLETIEDVKTVLRLGLEKVVFSTAAFKNPLLIEEAAERFGSQAVVVSVDYRQSMFRGPRVAVQSGTRLLPFGPDEAAARAVRSGAGEILLMSIDRDGTKQGYDIDTVRRIASAVPVPVVACGGAGSLQHVRDVLLQGRASAAAGGSIFVYYGRRSAVLINVPEIPSDVVMGAQ